MKQIEESFQLINTEHELPVYEQEMKNFEEMVAKKRFTQIACKKNHYDKIIKNIEDRAAKVHTVKQVLVNKHANFRTNLKSKTGTRDFAIQQLEKQIIDCLKLNSIQFELKGDLKPAHIATIIDVDKKQTASSTKSFSLSPSSPVQTQTQLREES